STGQKSVPGSPPGPNLRYRRLVAGSRPEPRVGRGPAGGGTGVRVEQGIHQDPAGGGREGSRAPLRPAGPGPTHAPAPGRRLLVAPLPAVVVARTTRCDRLGPPRGRRRGDPGRHAW